MKHRIKVMSLFLIFVLVITQLPVMEHQVHADNKIIYVTAMSYPAYGGEVSSQSDPEWKDMVYEWANPGPEGTLTRFLHARPAEGYKFVEWRKNGNFAGRNNGLQIVIREENEGDLYTAVFAKEEYSAVLTPAYFGMSNTGRTFSTTSERRVIYLTNTGTETLIFDSMQPTLSGTNADCFSIRGVTVGAVPAGRTSAIGTIVPNDDLPAGTYKATINYQDHDGKISVSSEVSYLVTGNTTPRYLVNLVSDGGGTASMYPASGPTGTTVQLTVTPDVGYEFSGWEVYYGGVTVNDNQFTIGNKDVKLCAHFDERSSTRHAVNFNTMGGCYVPRQIVWFADKAEEPAPARKLNVNFAGWYTDPYYTDLFDFDSLITADTTVYARYESRIYGYAYDRTSGSYRTGGTIQYRWYDPATSFYEVLYSDSHLTLYAEPDYGYRFVEWREGNGLDLDYEDCVSMDTDPEYILYPTEHTTVYAVFEEIPPTYITQVNFTADKPVLGKTPDPTVSVTTVPAGGVDAGEYPAIWGEATKADLSDADYMSTETFEEGKYYILAWPSEIMYGTAFTPNWYLDPECTATFNGEEIDFWGTYLKVFDPMTVPTTLDVEASNTANGIKLTWNGLPQAASYDVYAVKGSNETLLKNTTETSYTDSRNLKMGTTYKYHVVAKKSNGKKLKEETISLKFNPFRDVSLSDPSAEYIAWAYNNSVVKGSVESDGYRYFNPNGSTTRMNFVMILWKMHGKPVVSGSNPFTDVSGTTSVNAVKWAVQKGIVKGTSATTFSPEDPLSRMNIIMILWKLAGSPKASTTTDFVDLSGSKAIKAVNWAVKKGIITGVDATHFDPDGDCSRALLVEVLYKYNQNYPLI